MLPSFDMSVVSRSTVDLLDAGTATFTHSLVAAARQAAANGKIFQVSKNILD
jgi:hypothetical protein